MGWRVNCLTLGARGGVPGWYTANTLQGHGQSTHYIPTYLYSVTIIQYYLAPVSAYKRPLSARGELSGSPGESSGSPGEFVGPNAVTVGNIHHTCYPWARHGLTR